MSLLDQPLLSDAQLHELFERAQYGSAPYQHRLLKQAQYGDAASRFRGSGTDYEDSRHYETGDEPRFFNWRLMARTGEAHVKVFREERRPSVFILLDRRMSMRYGTRERLKVTQANRLAALVAFAAAHQGWTVSGVLLDEEPQWLDASQELTQIWQLVQQGSRAAPPLEDSPDYSIDEVLLALREHVLPGMHIYLISDFMTDALVHYASLLALTEEHPVFAVQIVDASELALPNSGQYEFLGLGSDQRDRMRYVQGSNLALRDEYSEVSARYLEQLKEQLRQYGLNFYRLMGHDDKPEQTVPLPQGVDL